METHLVHWNKKYGDATSAMKHRDGLAVIGYLYEKASNVANEIDNNLESNEVGKDLKRAVWKITHVDNQISFEDLYFYFKKFFPQKLAKKNSKYYFHIKASAGLTVDNYYTYWGSLTTPACNEVNKSLSAPSLEIELIYFENFRLFTGLSQQKYNL